MISADRIRGAVRGSVAEDEPMSAHTSLGVGGPADFFVSPADEDDLCALMKSLSQAEAPWFILGDGTNLLIADKGIRGVVIDLGTAFSYIEVDGLRIRAGSAATLSRVADAAAEHNLGGLEGAGTVPGSIGGAIVMNAGTHRGYIDEVVESVSLVTAGGEKRTLGRDECGFGYRTSRFQKETGNILTSVALLLKNADGKQIAKHLADVRNHRAETQPQGWSAGCFFKNPPDVGAGRLIELAGGKGLREGGAYVSDIHANFIMNSGDATAEDLRRLAERVRELVQHEHGVELEYEVRLVGEW